MTDDILSQAEVESLLSALEPASEPPTEEPLAPAPAPRPVLTKKVAHYEFKRPERVGKEPMRCLQKLHECFSQNVSDALSSLMRRIVHVKLTSVDQLTYSEFVFSLESPTCFIVVRADSLDQVLTLDINPMIFFPMIDRLLGGKGASTTLAKRPLTEIETQLVPHITTPLLSELSRVWADVLDLQMHVDRVESNPQLVQAIPPNEVVVVVGFEVTLGENRGMMNLCLPYSSIQQAVAALTDERRFGGTIGSAAEANQLRRRIDQSELSLTVKLAQQKIALTQLLDLRVGDIITTDNPVKSPLVVEVEGIAKFRGEPGALNGRKAIQIQDVVLNKPSSG